uniref:Enoyl-CoA hydratase/isomerase n=1 Tax=uncultured bacterium esnapd16.1 TaxID=1366596 RepID=S5UD11_9BACT|nr:enoyl-CoA hydratase/isomerase [uncultured bacterium esnapd16.1]
MVTAAAVGDLVLRVDGTKPVALETVEALQNVCDRAEDQRGPGLLVVHVSGRPEPGWAKGFSVGLLTKWERAVRRLEHLDRMTVAVAAGVCGGTAFDVLMATDVRIALAGAAFVVTSTGDASWPGMALYRLARQSSGAPLRKAALLSTSVDAEAAAAAGLIDAVVDRADEALAELAAAASSVTGTELAIRRRLILDAAQHSFEEALGSHLAACDRALRRAAAS